MLMVAVSRMPWLAAYFATLGVLALGVGAWLGADLYGSHLITAAVTLAVIKPKEEESK